MKLTLFLFLFLLYFASTNPQANKQIPCDPNKIPQYCDDYINPVCGYFKDCKGEGCTVTFGNNCTACQISAVESYSLGICQYDQASSQSFCDAVSLSKICLQVDGSVCSITEENCWDLNSCASTVPSACIACSNSSVTSYISGECFDFTKRQKIMCDPDHRPENCGNKTDFICAFFSDGHSATLLSPCYACRDPEVNYYFFGVCSQDSNKTFCAIETIPPPCPPPPDWLYQPVCAYLRNCTEEPCRYTAEYACPVCASNNVDYYIDGACQTSCSSKNIDEFCGEESPQPVCAYTGDCMSESCGTTMDSSCDACNNAKIEYFTDKACYDPREFSEKLAP